MSTPPKKPSLFSQLFSEETKNTESNANAPESSKNILDRNELSLTLTIYLEKGGHLMAVLLGYVMRVAAPNIFKHPQEPVPKLKNLLDQLFKLESHPKDQPLTHTPIVFTGKITHPSEKTPPTLTIFIKSIETRVELKILAEGKFDPNLIIEYMRFLMTQLDSFQQVKAELNTPNQASMSDLDIARAMAGFFIRGIQIQGSNPEAQKIINQSSLAGLPGGWQPRFMPLNADGQIVRPGTPGNNTGMSGPRT